MIIATLISLLFFIIAAGLYGIRRQGKAIPISVIILFMSFGAISSTMVKFIYFGEDYQAYQKLNWQPLVPSKIEDYLAQGYRVFVDITADWCNVCAANKANALHRNEAIKVFENSNIILMRGDLSQSNPIATQYLNANQALGLPYNRFYTPAHPQGIELPRELTLEILLKVLKQP